PVLALPWFFPRGRRRAALFVWSQIAAQAFVWAAVPYADRGTIFANIRYLDGALGLAFAGGLAALELRGTAERWLEGLALALVAQDLLQLHADMPRSVRLAMAGADLAALAAAPFLAAFRVADRGRAMALDLSVHATPVHLFARAWSWLEAYGGNGTVAVASSPQQYFVYPAMGPRLERRAVFANVNAEDFQNAAAYPACDPRTSPSADAWIANL